MEHRLGHRLPTHEEIFVRIGAATAISAVMTDMSVSGAFVRSSLNPPFSLQSGCGGTEVREVPDRNPSYQPRLFVNRRTDLVSSGPNLHLARCVCA